MPAYFTSTDDVFGQIISFLIQKVEPPRYMYLHSES